MIHQKFTQVWATIKVFKEGSRNQSGAPKKMTSLVVLSFEKHTIDGEI